MTRAYNPELYDRYKKIIALHDEGKKPTEIAKILNITNDYVTQVTRAKKSHKATFRKVDKLTQEQINEYKTRYIAGDYVCVLNAELGLSDAQGIYLVAMHTTPKEQKQRPRNTPKKFRIARENELAAREAKKSKNSKNKEEPSMRFEDEENIPRAVYGVPVHNKTSVYHESSLMEAVQ
jgi:hypothetical protein